MDELDPDYEPIDPLEQADLDRKAARENPVPVGDSVPLRVGQVRRARYSRRHHKVLYIDVPRGIACVAPVRAVEDDSWDRIDTLEGWSLVRETPSVDADMLRRAAEACRSATSQMHGRTDWFAWVPQHLDQAADRLGGGS